MQFSHLGNVVTVYLMLMHELKSKRGLLFQLSFQKWRISGDHTLSYAL